jgi:hypothetical protein
MAVASTLTVVAAALLGPRTPQPILVEFYQRVRPPGWWTASAKGAGIDRRVPLVDLYRRVRRAVACAVSTYAWLVGAAGALIGSGSGWWTLLLLAVGFAAVPLWWSSPARP